MADGSRTVEIEADAAAAEAAREAKADVLERAAKVESAEALPLTGKAGKTKADKASKKSQWAEFACEVLVPGGAFLCKVFQGGAERELLDRLKRAFATVRHVKPPASRAESAELYVIATGFRGAEPAPR